jgi:hypothetical protein
MAHRIVVSHLPKEHKNMALVIETSSFHFTRPKQVTGKSAGCPVFLLQGRGGRKRTPEVESKPTL